MLLLITITCVIAEKKLQLNSASLYVVVIFIIGGILIGGARAPWAPPWLRLCKKLGFLKLHDVYKFELAKFMHKLFKNKLPKLCNYNFTTIDKIHDYATRNPSRFNCFLPRVYKSAGQNKIKFRGAKLWKEVSENLKNKPFNSFKKQFQENLLREY